MNKLRVAFFGLAHPHCTALLKAIKNDPDDFEIIGFADYPETPADHYNYESRRELFAVQNGILEYKDHRELIAKKHLGE